MFNKKSIVLSGTDGSKKKAVLTLSEQKDGVSGTVRLYNFERQPLGICSLGLYVDKKVFKAGLSVKGTGVFDLFLDIEKIPAKFSVAIVNFVGGEPSPILYGSSEGSPEDVYASVISELSGKKNVSDVQKTLDRFGVDFDEEEKEIVENEIDKAFEENECEKDCENCVYKKFFFKMNENSDKNFEFSKNKEKCLKNDEKTAKKVEKMQNSKKIKENVVENDLEDKIEEKTEEDNEIDYQNEQEIFDLNGVGFEETKEGKQKNENVSEYVSENVSEYVSENVSENVDDLQEDLFYNRLKPQIDKLFEKNPAEQNLQDLIPSSKWVKVEYEDDGDFYVFGLLYDEQGQVRYVCYGVPAVFEENPPKELSGFPIWLPLRDEKGFGYWLTYQDASTGEPVKAVFE